MDTSERWLEWAVEIQSIAQAGLTYGADRFDLERYARLREISAEMLALKSGIPAERVRELFCNESGYQTPKLDTRAAVFDGERILLVRESDGLWALPGGWCDVNLSVRENALKELREEAGMEAVAERLIAVQDRAKHNRPVYAYGIIKIFVECRALGGAFQPNSETTERAYFAEDALPELDGGKNTPEQIQMCFRAHRDPAWAVEFD